MTGCDYLSVVLKGEELGGFSNREETARTIALGAGSF